MSTRKLRSKFTWDEKSCDKKYFKSVVSAMKEVKIPNNTGPYTQMRFTRKLKVCKKWKLGCELDDFHSGEKYLQLIIGRLATTSNCYTKCKNYWALFANKWSFFRNDAFIYNMIHNNYFYKKYVSLPVDPVFPIRILVTNGYLIPPHRMRKMTSFIKDYGYDFVKGKAISDRMAKLIEEKYPELTKYITKTLPMSHVVSRELCLLKMSGLYFYIAKDIDQKLYKPYVLVSEKPISEIKKIYEGSKYEFEYL